MPPPDLENQDVVLSLDFDKCLVDIDYLNPEGELVDAERQLASLIESAKTILVGSNRQSHEIDRSNGNGTCFDTFIAYEERFYRLLASDIQRDEEAGFTLNQTPEEALADDFKYIDDELKRTLIYSQIHAMATLRQSQGLTGNFVFKFVDDREDILEALNVFFTTNPDFIPEGVTLQLFQYCPREGKTLQQHREDIYGTGIIDANYVNTSNAITNHVDKNLSRLSTKEEKEKYYRERLNLIRILSRNNEQGECPTADDYEAYCTRLKEEAKANRPMIEVIVAHLGNYQDDSVIDSPILISPTLVCFPLTLKSDTGVEPPKLNLNLIYNCKTENWTLGPSEVALSEESAQRTDLFNMIDTEFSAVTVREDGFIEIPPGFLLIESACSRSKEVALDELGHKHGWESKTTKMLSLNEILFTFQLKPPVDANGGLGNEGLKLDLIYNIEMNTWVYEGVEIPKGKEAIWGDRITAFERQPSKDWDGVSQPLHLSLDCAGVEQLLEQAFSVMLTDEECQRLISEAGAQLSPMVNEFIAASSKYTGFQFYEAQVVSPYQVSYRVLVESRANSPTLNLLFTYDSRTRTWDVEKSSHENEADLCNEFLYDYVDSRPLEVSLPALRKPVLQTIEANEGEGAGEVDGLLVIEGEGAVEGDGLLVTEGEGANQKFVETHAPISSSASVGAFEVCYRRMTQLQQKQLDCYAAYGLQTNDPLESLSVDQDVANDILAQMRQTMAEVNALEDQIFDLLGNVAQQGYLDDCRGNVIEQLLTPEDRNVIIDLHSSSATYDSEASTLAYFGQYRSVFVGGPGDSRDDPLLWKPGRILLIEGLLKECVAQARRPGIAEADKAKAEWLGGVINLIGRATQLKENLSTPYRLLRDQGTVNGVDKLANEKVEWNWPETFRQLDQLQAELARETDAGRMHQLKAKRLELLHLVYIHCSLLQSNEHNGVSSFSDEETEAMRTAETGGLLSPPEVVDQNSPGVSQQRPVRRFKRIDHMTPDQITALIAVTRQFRSFQWQPSQIDQGLKTLPRLLVTARPKKSTLRGLRVRQEESKTNWKRVAMIGGALLGMATIAVLTVGSFGLLPAGFAVLGTAGYATWQLFLMFVGSGVVGAGLGWGVHKGAQKLTEPHSHTTAALETEPLAIRLRAYSPQQLRKAFFATIVRPEDEGKRKAVREAVMKTRLSENGLFASIFTSNGDGDYGHHPKRDAFDPANFSSEGRLSLLDIDHVVHPREIAYYYASLNDSPTGTRRKLMEKMKSSPWVKRELALFLVHAILFDNATEKDRQCATSLLTFESLTDIREALLAPPAPNSPLNEQRSFIDSFLLIAGNEKYPIPSTPKAAHNSRCKLLKQLRQECNKQDQRQLFEVAMQSSQELLLAEGHTVDVGVVESKEGDGFDAILRRVSAKEEDIAQQKHPQPQPQPLDTVAESKVEISEEVEIPEEAERKSSPVSDDLLTDGSIVSTGGVPVSTVHVPELFHQPPGSKGRFQPSVVDPKPVAESKESSSLQQPPVKSY